ncbi:MAG: type II toxin-antitoxin system RelE/ParE family toxin [Bacteroidales bacterium]|nr:type II toxin-antitoxin system RelE/ParE family toxin [Bacteroidales bacterium]
MKDGGLPKADRRILYKTTEFSEFYNQMPLSVQLKFEYVFNIVQTVYILPTKFVKRLVGSRFYELRVSIGTNAYRIILFAIDHENVIEATRIVLLHAFLKKSEKDYGKQIEKADKILKDFMI